MRLRVASMDMEAARLLTAPSLAQAGWTIHARFERALIVSNPRDEALVSLVRNDLPDGPYTARLDRRAPRDFRSICDPPDLDTTEAEPWQALPVAPADAAEPGEVLRRLAALAAVARRAGAGGRGIYSVAHPEELDALAAAVAEHDAPRVAGAAARFAGLGPGLTPSGDDLLAGVMAFGAWGAAAGVLSANAGLREAIREAAASRTTRFAAQMLGAASRGYVPAPLATLLGTLLRRDSAGAPDVARLLAVGETSGGDMLTGVLLGGPALLGRRRIPAPDSAVAVA